MKEKVSGLDVFIYISLIISAIFCAAPGINLAAVSLSGQNAIESGRVLFWPVDFTLDTFVMLFKGTSIIRAFRNSVVITVVGVVLNMVMTVLAAYPLSRSYFWGRKTFSRLTVFTMLFSGGMIPTYILVKQLGMIDHFSAIWLPGLISTYNMMIMRSFFESIPEELAESARIDGCGEWRLLFNIFLPLSKPVAAALILFYGVAQWNTFMDVLLYINSSSKMNLSVFVQQMIQSQQALKQLENINPNEIVNVASAGIKAAATVVMVVPMLIVYPFVQKYFVKGVMLGAIKG
jgi:putative aldouronate transport system permease protein